ncbi:MAG: T9SS type A sorting domain-containing protein [Bacteroidota bacterium]|nr:T9SS type A sorting domain-containing protein [Bacteroidota bacterium]
MKRITFLALAMCMTFGLMAQEFLKPVGKRVNTPVTNGIALKTTSSTISNVTVGAEVLQTNEANEEYIGFPVSYTISLNDDAVKCFSVMYGAGQLQAFIDTSSTYNSMDEYLLAYANYYIQLYAAYGMTYDPFTTGGTSGYSGLYGNTQYEVYVLSINADTTETHVTTQIITTPNSTNWNGTATATVSKTDDVSVGEINWNVSVENTREFYFFCEENNADGARYYIENYGMEEEEGYAYNAYAWGNSNYSQYFSYEWNGDVNTYWAGNLFTEDGTWVEGTEYVYGLLPYNGNGEEGTFTYAIFTYGSANLNDVVELTNMQVYPNPARETLNINSKVNMTKVELYNTLGQVVYTNSVNSNSVNIPVSNLNNGTYIVKAYADGVVVNRKVVIE